MGDTSSRLIRRGTGPVHDLRHGRGTSESIVGVEDGMSTLVLHRVTIAPGTQPGPYHLHRNAGNVYVGVSGEVEVRTADGTVVLGPGDAIHIPPGQPHATHNATSGPVELLALYDHPVSADFEVVEPA